MEQRLVSALQAIRCFALEAVLAAQQEREALLASPSADSVHRARIALRRLRGSLALFRPASTECFRECDGPLKRLSRILGNARDLDVFRVTISELDVMSFAARAQIVARADASRDEAYALAIKTFGSDETSELLARLATLLESGPSGHPDLIPHDRRRPHADADRIVKRSWRRVRRRGERIEELGRRGRHQLRIRARHLQVAMEIMGPLLAAGAEDEPRSRFSAALDRVQRRLGELNDIATARFILGQLRESGDGTPVPVGGLLKALRRRARASRRRLASQYRGLVDLREAWSQSLQ